MANVRHWTRDWLAWLLIVVPVVSAMGLVDLARDVGRPYGGYISFTWVNQSIGIVATTTPIWWAGLVEGGLTTDGTLLEADGLDYAPHARDVFAAAAAAGRPTVEILHDEPGSGPMVKAVPVTRFSIADLVELRFPELINGLAFWLLAIAVYRVQPNAAPNRAFVLIASLVAAYRMIADHTVFLDYDGYSLLVHRLFATTIALIGVCTIYFALCFPEPIRPDWLRRISRVLLVTGIFLVIVYQLSLIPGLPTEPVHWNQRLDTVAYYGSVYTYLIALIVLLGRLGALAISGRTNKRHRRIATILGIGIGLALPMLLLTVTEVLPFFGKEANRHWLGGLDLRYLLVIVAMAFAYTIIRYQSMQSPSRLFLGVLLLAGSGLLAGIGAWIWTMFQPDWPESMASPPSVYFFAVALTSGLIWSILANWRGALGRLFDWERHSYATTREFARRTMGQGDLSVLPQTIATVLAEEMQLEQVGLWFRANAETQWLQLAGHVGEKWLAWPNRLHPDLLRLDDPAPLSLVSGKPIPAWVRPLQATHFEVMAPLQNDGELIGLIALGGRWDEEIFDNRDLELAEQIAQQATLFIVAARTAAELRRMPGRMADVQEQERTRLAQELHDTIQQFLGRLPFYLAVSRDSMERSPVQAMELLDRSITDVEEAAHQLRLIRHNLAPSQLQSGLSMPLLTMATHFQRRTGLPVALDVAEEIDAGTTVETRHALYRVIQQALDNVELHAAAREVSVQVSRENGRVQFAVIDDGQGFTAAQQAATQAAGSFGLLSMRARLESCNGELDIQSSPGAGTRVCGWVPSANSATY